MNTADFYAAIQRLLFIKKISYRHLADMNHRDDCKNLTQKVIKLTGKKGFIGGRKGWERISGIKNDQNKLGMVG